jgi:hypothetical protein
MVLFNGWLKSEFRTYWLNLFKKNALVQSKVNQVAYMYYEQQN